MKKSLLLVTASFVALSFAAPAMAADMRAPAPVYTKAPVMMPVALYDWSGFYVGLNGGGAWSNSCWDTLGQAATSTTRAVTPGPEGCHNADGGTVGGQIGYRWQAANWVFGLEAQGNWADLSGSNQSLKYTNINRSRIDSFGLLTGQVGYAWNNVLLYVKGGGAVVDTKYDILNLDGSHYASAGSDSRWGGTVGTGLELGFAPNWTVGVEYNHIFLSDKTYTFTTPAGLTVANQKNISQDIDMALVRLNYKFGGPIVARY